MSVLNADTAGAAGAAKPPWRLALDRFLRHPGAVISLIWLVLLFAACFSAPVIEQMMGIDPERPNLLNRFGPPGAEHPLGTDSLGRDMLLRLLHGGRISLTVGLTTALFAALIGTFIGLLAGFFGGWPDAALMRLTDGVIALPILPLLIVLAAIDVTKLGVPADIAYSEDVNLARIVIIIALFGWTTVARLVRGAALSVRQRDYVRAATALGATNSRIILRHVLPNILSPIVVATTLSIGAIILAESVLSFLALGIQPPTPSWGNMLTGAQDLMGRAPLLALWPGLAIFTTVMAFNFLGDGLQDALDPRATSRR